MAPSNRTRLRQPTAHLLDHRVLLKRRFHRNSALRSTLPTTGSTWSYRLIWLLVPRAKACTHLLARSSWKRTILESQMARLVSEKLSRMPKERLRRVPKPGILPRLKIQPELSLANIRRNRNQNRRWSNHLRFHRKHKHCNQIFSCTRCSTIPRSLRSNQYQR